MIIKSKTKPYVITIHTVRYCLSANHFSYWTFQIRISRVIAHPDFSRAPPYPNDIALVRLTSLAVLHPAVAPAYLPLGANEVKRVLGLSSRRDLVSSLDGEKGIVVGWGNIRPFGDGEIGVNSGLI